MLERVVQLAQDMAKWEAEEQERQRLEGLRAKRLAAGGPALRPIMIRTGKAKTEGVLRSGTRLPACLTTPGHACVRPCLCACAYACDVCLDHAHSLHLACSLSKWVAADLPHCNRLATAIAPAPLPTLQTALACCSRQWVGSPLPLGVPPPLTLLQVTTRWPSAAGAISALCACWQATCCAAR